MIYLNWIFRLLFPVVLCCQFYVSFLVKSWSTKLNHSLCLFWFRLFLFFSALWNFVRRFPCPKFYWNQLNKNNYYPISAEEKQFGGRESYKKKKTNKKKRRKMKETDPLISLCFKSIRLVCWFLFHFCKFCFRPLSLYLIMMYLSLTVLHLFLAPTLYFFITIIIRSCNCVIINIYN